MEMDGLYGLFGCFFRWKHIATDSVNGITLRNFDAVQRSRRCTTGGWKRCMNSLFIIDGGDLLPLSSVIGGNFGNAVVHSLCYDASMDRFEGTAG